MGTIRQGHRGQRGGSGAAWAGRAGNTFLSAATARPLPSRVNGCCAAYVLHLEV